MIESVEVIGEQEPCKYKVFYNYGAYKREFIGEHALPETVKKFLENGSYAKSNGASWITYYRRKRNERSSR